MANTPKVSIIVPVYNAETDLAQCLESLLGQTMDDFELICIDDGSTDGTSAILNAYASADERMRVIAQSNAGAGAARNAGMRLATGEYLAFLDCDDFFEAEMLERAYAKATDDNLDIIVFRCDSYIEPDGRTEPCTYSIRADLLPANAPFAGVDVERDLFKVFVGWAWDKLFRRSFVEGLKLQFQEQRTTNDMLFVFSAVAKASRIGTMDDVLAHHRRSSGTLSVTREKSWHCFYDALRALREQLYSWGLYDRFERDFVNYCVHASLWNLSTLAEPTRSKLYDKLHNGWLAELGVTAHNRSYFYNQDEWRKARYIAELPQEATSHCLFADQIVPVLEEALPLDGHRRKSQYEAARRTVAGMDAAMAVPSPLLEPVYAQACRVLERFSLEDYLVLPPLPLAAVVDGSDPITIASLLNQTRRLTTIVIDTADGELPPIVRQGMLGGQVSLSMKDIPFDALVFSFESGVHYPEHTVEALRYFCIVEGLAPSGDSPLSCTVLEAALDDSAGETAAFMRRNLELGKQHRSLQRENAALRSQLATLKASRSFVAANRASGIAHKVADACTRPLRQRRERQEAAAREREEREAFLATKNLFILGQKNRPAANRQVNLDYWKPSGGPERQNLGDYLSVVVCEWMLSRKGIDPAQPVGTTSFLMAIGSILHAGCNDATVWGSGLLWPECPWHLAPEYRTLDIRAVRGPCTRKLLLEAGFDCPEVYGDPAVLMPLLYQPPAAERSGILTIKHMYDQRGADLNILTKDYKGFIDKLAAAELVVTSSLHGIILAEAYGTPAVLVNDGRPDFNPLKYDDWYRSTGRESYPVAASVEEARLIAPPPLPELSKLQEGLLASFPYDLWK